MIIKPIHCHNQKKSFFRKTFNMVQLGNNKTLKTFSNKLHTELLGCDFKKTSSVKSMSIKSKTRVKT
jgi:hypothetical protein